MPSIINITSGIQEFQCEIYEYPCDVGALFYILVAIIMLYILTDVLLYNHTLKPFVAKRMKYLFRGRENEHEEM